MKLSEYLAGRTVGTAEVPVLTADVRPFTSDPADNRRVVSVELVVSDGADLVKDESYPE